MTSNPEPRWRCVAVDTNPQTRPKRYRIERDDTRKLVGYIYGDGEARLAAAAPELYAALGFALQHCNHPRAERVAVAALQEAEGTRT